MDANKLADALAGATAEQLREMAHDSLSYIEYRAMTAHGANSMRTLAALALAIAAMQERGEIFAAKYNAAALKANWSAVDMAVAYSLVSGVEAVTLPAALADLLRSLGRDA